MPDEDALEVLESILAQRARYKDFYNAFEKAWKNQFRLYLEVRGEPKDVGPVDLKPFVDDDQDLAIARKQSLINLYDAKEGKEPYDLLSKMRRDHGLLFCPSCGEDGAPRTLDHYLPKKIYPELSVLIANLTPMCDECQEKKGTEYETEDGDKIFIHPYFDEILQPLFKLEIGKPYSSPQNFTLNVDSSLPGELASLVSRHTSGVNLKGRYEKFCREKYMHLLKLVSDERQDEDPIPAKKLVKRFLKLEEMKALNAWGAVFYRSVIRDEELIEYLDHGLLPTCL